MQRMCSLTVMWLLQVMFCCCISKGAVKLGVELDKGAYYVGETANINVNIQNNSSVDVSSTFSTLHQE